MLQAPIAQVSQASQPAPEAKLGLRQGLGLYPRLGLRLVKAALLLPLSLASALGLGQAFAQASAETPELDTEEGIEDLSEDEESAWLEAIRKEKAPENSQDYAEIHQLRSLERRLLPAPKLEQDASTHTLAPTDPMALSHESVMGLLLKQGKQVNSEAGLQRQGSRIMQEALEELANTLEKRQSRHGSLALPFGLNVIDQPAVQEYLALFSAPGAQTIKVWLQRAGKWSALISRIMKEEDVPEDFLYLAMIESGFKTRVKSHAAAAGMWQFIPSTGIAMGLRIDEWVDERFDPVKSAHAAAQYLKRQYARYQSWPLAMAAYNGGPGTVNVAIDRFNSTDYFKLVSYGAMYDETRRYVPKIMAAAIIGKNKEAFGFAGLNLEAPLSFDLLELEGGQRLSVIAEACACSVETLKELNPELLKEQVPPRRYKLRVPEGSHAHCVQR